MFNCEQYLKFIKREFTSEKIVFKVGSTDSLTSVPESTLTKATLKVFKTDIIYSTTTSV